MPKVPSEPHWELGKIQIRDREILQVYQGAKVLHTLGIEDGRDDPRKSGRLLELHPLDERQQFEFIQGSEWVEVFTRDIHGPLPERHGMVEVRNRDVVPGGTGRGTSSESRRVVCEVGDDHFYDLWREPVWLVIVRWCTWVPEGESALEFSF